MNASNPYNSTTIWHGKLDPNHTTDVGFVYSPQSFITPWPYLLCNVALSLTLGLMAYFKVNSAFATMRRIYVPSDAELARWRGDEPTMTDLYRGALTKPKEEGVIYLADGTRAMAPQQLPRLPGPKRKDRTIYCAVLGISLIRASTLLVSAVRALISGSGGHLRSCTSIFIAWLPMVDFCNNINKNRHLKFLMEIGVIMMCAALQIMIWPRIITNLHFYGQWFMHGGECAFAVRSCTNAFTKVGCGLNTTDFSQESSSADIPLYDFNKIGSPNYVSDAEPIVGQVLNVGGLLFVASAYVCIRATVKYVRGNRKRKAVALIAVASSMEEWKTQVKWRYLDVYRQRNDMFYKLGMITALGILCTVMHYCQQTRPKPMFVVDSYGPLMENGAGNGSWSDCFRVLPVHDEYGHFHFWWNEVKTMPLEWISFI